MYKYLLGILITALLATLTGCAASHANSHNPSVMMVVSDRTDGYKSNDTTIAKRVRSMRRATIFGKWLSSI